MRLRTYKGYKACTTYPTVPGLIFVAECDAGHAMLCAPQPDDFIPLPDKAMDESSAGVVMARVPYSLTNLHVRGAYRGQGIGGKLVQRCQDYAAAQGVPIVLRAHPYGKAKPLTLAKLVEFYESCGFGLAGKHHGNTYMIWEPPRA